MREFGGLVPHDLFTWSALLTWPGFICMVVGGFFVGFGTAYAGDIVAFFGVDCASGDTFTDGTHNVSMQSMHVPDAVISLAIAPKDKLATNNFSKALQKFRKEDPTFRVHRDEESAETIISGMGELHLEIYVERMKREFNCEVVVGQPQVAYRETIMQDGPYDYTHKKQTGGSGQFAKVVGKISPLVPDPENPKQTFAFTNDVVGGRIPREFIPAVEEGFQEQCAKGPLIGFPIVGVNVVLEDGSYHDVDSSYMAFKICAMAAMREAYQKAIDAYQKEIDSGKGDKEAAAAGINSSKQALKNLKD